MEQDYKKYEDIIDLPHPTSGKHPPMSVMDRAAQFSSFAALTGHAEAIEETARLTDVEIELDGDMIADLNDKLQIIQQNLDHDIRVSITHFVPDEMKSGGEYVTSEGMVKKIDEFSHKLIMEDNREILINKIIDISIEQRKEAHN